MSMRFNPKKFHKVLPSFSRHFLELHPLAVWALSVIFMFIPFVIVTWIYGARIIDTAAIAEGDASNFFAWPAAWTAFLMSLLSGAIVWAQATAQLSFAANHKRFTTIFVKGEIVAERAFTLSASQVRLIKYSNYTSLLAGLVVAICLVVLPAQTWREVVFTPRPWFVVVGTVLISQFVRALLLSTFEHSNLRAALKAAQLQNPFSGQFQTWVGDLAIRRMGSWMIVVAISTIFLVRGEDVDVAVIPWITVAAAFAVHSFYSALELGYDLVERHKLADLTAIRLRINEDRQKLLVAEGEVPLTSLSLNLQLEARLEAIKEWSFTFPVAWRFTIYTLLPILAWLSASVIPRMILTILE